MRSPVDPLRRVTSHAGPCRGRGGGRQGAFYFFALKRAVCFLFCPEKGCFVCPGKGILLFPFQLRYGFLGRLASWGLVSMPGFISGLSGILLCFPCVRLGGGYTSLVRMPVSPI